jgi:hypothetical protein
MNASHAYGRGTSRFSRTVARVLALGMALTPLAHADRPAGPQILHLPPARHEAEQGILTPIPIQITIPDRIAAYRVLAHYKIRGVPYWTTLELVPFEGGWRGAIPCLEVSTITGDVAYYIRVHDHEGNVVAYSGTRHTPYRVLIVHDSARTEATLERPSCPDPADCPRGLLGCPSEIVEKIPCGSDTDCEGEASCSWDGFCEVDPRRHTWINLSVSQEFGWIDTTGACTLEAQENEGSLCERRFDDAIYYGPSVYTNEPRKFGLGNSRVWLGLEQLVSYDTSVRLRVGYAVLGVGPTAPGGVPFVPLAAELGVVHWFGDDPFRRAGWRPFVGLGMGYGMFDIRSSVHVRADVTRADPQGGNDLDQQVDLWKRAGDAFVALGGGAVLASESGWAARAELTVAKAFPFDAIIIAPRLGVEKGF